MLGHVYVAVDASEHSNAAVDVAVEVARACRARLTACHVYAGRLHDARFRQMEYTLPERYREEVELERQRTVHASLIERGLHLISESYLHEPMASARDAGLTCEPRVLDGRHWQALVEDVRRSDCDLVVMGALGMGAVGDSLLGSVTERFVRHTARDTLVVRTLDPTALGDAPIVVGLDGSAPSWRALQAGLALGRVLGRRVEALAVHDPYLHYVLFKRIVSVLPPEEARTFRFKEQEQLHEDIIDSGLARIYQSHLDVARRLGDAEGVDVTTHLLAGKAFERILHHCRTRAPWLLVMGRAGFHSDPEAGELGSTSENVLRLAPCNVLLTAGRFDLPDDVRAEETIAWTTEAEACMERVPGGVRAMARAAVLRYATEQGHTVITSAVIEDVMARCMPGRIERIDRLAEHVAMSRLAAGTSAVAVCSACGHPARGTASPVRCPICGAGAAAFQRIDAALAGARAAEEGGVVDREAMPGITVRWTAEARRQLDRVPGASVPQLEARVEKRARSLRLPVVTRGLVTAMMEPAIPDTRESRPPADERRPRAEMPGPGTTLAWTAGARTQLERVPAGFMREAARQEVERAAAANGVTSVDLALCETVIARLRATACRGGTEAAE